MLSDGSSAPADLVIVAAGVRPEDALARDAGLEVGERGGIEVDEQQRSSDPATWAAGDAAVKRDPVTGSPSLVALAQTANRYGRAPYRRAHAERVRTRAHRGRPQRAG